MKIAKKLTSLLLALVIVLSLAAPVFAAGPDGDTQSANKITIAGADNLKIEGRSFSAFKIMDMRIIDGDDTNMDSNPSPDGSALNAKDNDYIYTIPEEWKPFFQQYFTDLKDIDGNPMVPADALDYDALVRNALVAMDSETDALYDFARAALAYALDEKISATGTATGNAQDKAVFENLPLGYYLIQDTTNPVAGVNGDNKIVSAVILDSNDVDNLIITIKASAINIDKVIVEGRNENTKYTNGAIGDCVKFQLSSKVPDTHGFQMYTFRFNDTLSDGLTYYSKAADPDLLAANDEHSDSYIQSSHAHEMVVKVGDRTLTAVDDTYDPNSDANKEKADRYDVYVLEFEENNSQKFTVTLPYLLEAVKAGDWTEDDEVTVTYYAWINENAQVVRLTNPNEVTLTYSNNPNILVAKDPETGEPMDPDDEDYPENPDEDTHPEGTTPPIKVQVLTTEIQVNKVDNAGNPLTGAGFTLTGGYTTQSLISGKFFAEDATVTGDDAWYQLASGGYTQMAPTATNTDKYVQKDGTVVKYKLGEKQSVVKGEYTDDLSLFAMVDDDGVLKFTGLSEGEYVLSETVVPAGFNKLDKDIYFKLELVQTAGTETATIEDDIFDFELYMGTMENDVVTYEDEASANTSTGEVMSIRVINQAGQKLPSTGGMGTTLFYVVGSALVLAAVVLLITKKRMNG